MNKTSQRLREFARSTRHLATYRGTLESFAAEIAQLERERDQYRLGADRSGMLFGWCVENLPGFPEPSFSWEHDIQCRLKRGAELEEKARAADQSRSV